MGEKEEIRTSHSQTDTAGVPVPGQVQRRNSRCQNKMPGPQRGILDAGLAVTAAYIAHWTDQEDRL